MQFIGAETTYIAYGRDVTKAELIDHTYPSERKDLWGFDAKGNISTVAWERIDMSDVLFYQRSCQCLFIRAYETDEEIDTAQKELRDLRRENRRQREKLEKYETNYKELLTKHISLAKEHQSLDKHFKDMSVAFVGIRDSFIEAQRGKCELQLELAKLRRTIHSDPC